jgi:alkylresorcinol/alkylpyrone synthase
MERSDGQASHGYDTGMTRIVAVNGVLPPFRYAQADLTDLVAELCLPESEADRRALLDRVHANVQVKARHLVMPAQRYAELDGFSAANDVFVDAGLDLAEQAVRGALDRAGMAPGDVDVVVAVSVTGIAAPSLEARLVPRLGLRPDVVRVPVFGLGCVAGATGIALLHELLRGRPDGVAVLMAVELCSLTVQRGDSSMANLVASGLFGDGAAAVVATGGRRTDRRPAVVATRSHIYPDTEDVLGWRIGAHGFQVVLAPNVADVIAESLPGDVDGFLGAHGLGRADVAAWICHPGGPKVLEAVEQSLGLPADALARSWTSLEEVGNLSSVSVLHLLEEHMAAPPPAGAYGLLFAMGPGFTCQLVLLRW